MTLTRRQALALAATAPVAAVLPAAAPLKFAAGEISFLAVNGVVVFDSLRPGEWPTLSTLSTPQENRDRNQIDEACGTKSVQIDPTGDLCPDVSV